MDVNLSWMGEGSKFVKDVEMKKVLFGGRLLIGLS